MGLWKKIKEKRSERKAERAAIELSEREGRRAGDEDRPAGDPLEDYRLSGLKP